MANMTDQQLQMHWLNYGIREGRSASMEFFAQDYLARYPDLQRAFGNDFQALLEHYYRSGKKEGRVGREPARQ